MTTTYACARRRADKPYLETRILVQEWVGARFVDSHTYCPECHRRPDRAGDTIPPDKGCAASEKCVDCPLVVCRYEHPGGLRGAIADTIKAGEKKVVYMPPAVVAEPILASVVNETGVSLPAICGKSRKLDVVAARHWAMYRLKTETDLTLQAIGMVMGGRCHSSVHHGVKRGSRFA